MGIHWEKAIRIGVETKAGLVSQTLRHEVFGHLLDPLFLGYQLYTLKEQLEALDLVTDYLLAHPELVALPEDYQGDQSSVDLWIEVFDIPHLAWANLITDATSHDWLQEESEVTPEQIELVSAILAKSGFDLSIEKIKQVSQEAYEKAVAAMIDFYSQRPSYLASQELYQEIKEALVTSLSEWETVPTPTSPVVLTPTSPPPQDQPHLCPSALLPVALALSSWLIFKSSPKSSRPKNSPPSGR